MTWTWVLTALSIAGVLLNIRKNRICFAIWLLTNTTWAVVDWMTGLPAQAALFAVYAVLAVAGWVSWKRTG